MAGEADVAVEAVLRKGVPLVETELRLLRRRDEAQHVFFLDVPQPVARLDEVVAGVDVTGVLEREGEPARLRMDAQRGRLADPVRERDVEHLHVDLSHVASNPFLEDVDEEAAVLLAGHAAIGDV